MPNQQKRSHIHYTKHGEGKPVILIHGLAASSLDWSELIPAITSRGYRAIALDLLGHGDSAKPDELDDYQAEGLYRHLDDWLSELHLESPPILIGHSLGGYLSLLYALRNPDKVQGMVLIAPFYSPRQLSFLNRIIRGWPALGAYSVRFAPGWAIHAALGLDPTVSSHLSLQARRQMVEDYKRASPNIFYITHSLMDLTTELTKITPPTLILWGEADQTLLPASFPFLVQALPNASGKAFPSCGHQPHIGAAEIVNPLIMTFVDDIEG